MRLALFFNAASQSATQASYHSLCSPSLPRTPGNALAAASNMGVAGLSRHDQLHTDVSYQHRNASLFFFIEYSQ